MLDWHSCQICYPLEIKLLLLLLLLKLYPIWCNVNFVSLFNSLNNTKKQRKLNITPFFLVFVYHLKILGWNSGFRTIDDLPRAHCDETEFKLKFTIFHDSGREIEDIYFFLGEYQIYFIEYVENISTFTSASHE